MDFQLTDEQRMFQDAVAGLAHRHLADGALERTRLPVFPRDIARLFADHGLMGITIDEKLLELTVSDLSSLDGLDGAVRHVRPTAEGFRLLIDTRNLPESHHHSAGRSVATVSVVGRRLVTHPGLTHRALTSIPTTIEHWWTDDAALHLQVPVAEAAAAAQALHDELIGSPHQR